MIRERPWAPAPSAPCDAQRGRFERKYYGHESRSSTEAAPWFFYSRSVQREGAGHNGREPEKGLEPLACSLRAIAVAAACYQAKLRVRSRVRASVRRELSAEPGRVGGAPMTGASAVAWIT